jgi:hypothetical protein
MLAISLDSNEASCKLMLRAKLHLVCISNLRFLEFKLIISLIN